MILYSPDDAPTPATGEPVPIAVLASGSGTNFAAIADAIAAGDLHADLRCVVYNNPGAGVVGRAEARDIPATLVDHRRFAGREAFDAAVVDALRTHEVSWVVMAGWMRVATPTLLEAFPDRILNIHPSLLPSFRGLHAVEQALDAGVKITGCTVHVVRLAVDDGPIVAQAAVPVLPDDDADSLHARIHEAEHVLYPRAIAAAIG